MLDFLTAAATCATHLSRLGAEIVLWSSEEFGFCEVSDAWASGSSIMPQKKNPDAAELLRGKAPRVVAHLAALHGVMHGLPLTYNKDMQEDKEHLFDAVDTLELCLQAARGMLGGHHLPARRLAARRADEMIAAVDVADMLVGAASRSGSRTGSSPGSCATAVDSGRTLSQLTREELARALRRARRRVLRRALPGLVAGVEGVRGRDGAGPGARAARARAGGAGRQRLERPDAAFYARPVLDVAPDLLGCVVAPRRHAPA